MTAMNVDAITALKEDIEANIDAVAELKGKSQYLYSPEQLSQLQQRLTPPQVLFHYSGMQSDGNVHRVYFDIFLAAKSETMTQVKRNSAMPLATEVLQKLRKSMACVKNKGHKNWKLQSETPDFGEDDILLYRQRWYTTYTITN